MTAALLTAAWLGLLTALSPCPLATNIAAVSYLGRHAERPRRAFWSGAAYVLGRTLCYTVLGGALAAGLLAGSTASATFGRVVGQLVGPVLIIAGAMLLGLLPAPSFGGAGGLSRRLGDRGDAAGAFLLGVLFALSFCPASAALFFGGLVPLATRAESPVVVPAAYGIMTGIPVMVFACMLAAGSHRVGKVFDRIKTLERWLRLITGVVLMGVGLYLSVRTNLGW